MAQFATTSTAHTEKGLREELSNTIYRISPEETPLFSAIAKEGSDQVLTEWQTDALAAVDTANAQIEGDDVTQIPAHTPTVRVGNYQQISRKLVSVSGTVEAVNKAGRRSQLVFELAKKGLELRRDQEAIIFQNIAGDTGGVTTARQMATLGAWLKSNVDKEAGGGNPVYTSGVPGAARTDGTPRTFTEAIFKSVVQKQWASGGHPDQSMMYLGPVNKQRASGFTGVVTRNYDISNKAAKPTAVIYAVDIFVTDFGAVRVMPHRYMRELDGYLLDPNFLAIKTLRSYRTEKLAKTGDAEKRMLLTEWTLKVNQEAAHGLAADLTTT